MTVSHLTRTRDQLWSDLLVALGGDEAFLTRSISERKVLLEILDIYSSSISLLSIDNVDALLAAVVNAAGGSASHLRQNKHEMLAALVTALGGTPPSASASSTGELLAACVNAVDTGGGYTASAVHFDGSTWLENASTACTDNSKFSWVIWHKPTTPLSGNGGVVFVSDPANQYENAAQFVYGGNVAVKIDVSHGPLGNASYAHLLTDNPLSDSSWSCIIFSFDGDVSGAVQVKMYVGDAVAALSAQVDDTGTPVVSMAINGLPLFVGSDSFGDNLVGDVADIRIMPGISLLDVAGDIPLATRRLFIDANGKPVDPATASSSLGVAGAVLFSGDHTTFATNQGTGGVFTLTGTLTNATTSPSD